MASFSFNFLDEGRDSIEDQGGELQAVESVENILLEQTSIVNQVPIPRKFILELDDGKKELALDGTLYSNVTIGEEVFKYLYRKVDIDDESDSVDRTHDVIPGVYEGGYKAWECCFDLVRYMSEAQSIVSSLPREVN